jgi:alkanesulfonate monooxygenase SsuD/methylene tetrahydromethanopterin reductase-like flavin-dependent oxidoreductase (luciferase family)
MLAELRSFWEEGSPLGPRPATPRGPEILVGGLSNRAFARMARYADGYVFGGGPPRAFARAAEKARAAWIDAGRPGRPRLRAQAYFALGADGVVEAGRRHLRSYYAFLGPFAEKIAEGLLATPQALIQHVRGYAEAGCDELLLAPAVADLEQLDRLADVVGSLGKARAELTS